MKNFSLKTITCGILMILTTSITQELHAQKIIAEGPPSAMASETGILSQHNSNGYEAINNDFSGYVSLNNANHGFFSQYNGKHGFIAELNDQHGFYSNFNNNNGFHAENNMGHGFWAASNALSGFHSKNNTEYGFRAEGNDYDGFSSVGNGKDGIGTWYNDGNGIVSAWNKGYAGAFYGSTIRLGATVLINHNDDSRIDLELGGNGRISSIKSYVFYLNYDNGGVKGNESFQIRDGTRNNNALIVYENGNATFKGIVTAAAHFNSSDQRYKKNIIPLRNSLSNLSSINGVRYDWDQEKWPERGFSNEPQIGFIAQELEAVYPELVLTDEEGYKSVAYNKMTAVLVEAVKELNEKVIMENEALKSENEELKQIINGIEARVSNLEKLE